MNEIPPALLDRAAIGNDVFDPIGVPQTIPGPIVG